MPSSTLSAFFACASEWSTAELSLRWRPERFPLDRHRVDVTGAVLELRAGDFQRRALARDVVLGDGDLSFGGADLHVSVYIAHQGNQHIIVVGDGSQKSAIGGFDGAAQFTPDIDSQAA